MLLRQRCAKQVVAITLILTMLFLPWPGTPFVPSNLPGRRYFSPISYASLSETITTSENSIGTITFLIPSKFGTRTTKFGSRSPVGSPRLLDAVRHLCRKAYFFADGRVETRIQTIPSDVVVVDDDEGLGTGGLSDRLRNSTVLVAIGVQDAVELEVVAELFEQRRQLTGPGAGWLCSFALDCGGTAALPALVGPFDATRPGLVGRLLPWTREASARRLHDKMTELFDRWTSDDFAFGIMLFLNAFSGHEVDWVKHSIDATWEKGPVRNAQELYAMVSKCGGCIGNCVRDKSCRECISKMTKIDSRDQVESYRTIVSYESDLLRDFTLCIMTKNNIFHCDASIPVLPVVKPINTWRGLPLTEDAARSILVGHLDDICAPEGGSHLPISWKVACGANVAYDQFPSQNQLFYPAARGRNMWYDPVFRVETLDGRTVWCKRHYKVRPIAVLPGTFRLSVLDNGVTSNELWTVIGVADDLSWCAMHYAGAASEVGQRYLGGLLCTPDGQLPDRGALPAIWDLFREAGIEPWELYRVKNDDTSSEGQKAGPPPFDFYRGEVLKRRALAAVSTDKS